MTSAFQPGAFQSTAFQSGITPPPVSTYRYDPGYGPNGERRDAPGLINWLAQSPWMLVAEGFDPFTIKGLATTFVPVVSQRDNEAWESALPTDYQGFQLQTQGFNRAATALGMFPVPYIEQASEEAFEYVYLGGIV